MKSRALVLCFLASAACRGEPVPTDAIVAPSVLDARTPSDFVDPAAPNLSITPNVILGRKPLTYVAGTASGDWVDRQIATQTAALASLPALAEGARIVADTEVGTDFPGGLVVFGGPHVNVFVQRFDDTLGFVMRPGQLDIGGATFRGDDIRLIAAIPAFGGRPEMLLYAGTGTPGIAEIAAVTHGPEPILVADAFGRLVTGTWSLADGKLMAQLATPARRIDWRPVRRVAKTETAETTIDFEFPQMLAESPNEPALMLACVSGVEQVMRRLEIRQPTYIKVYVYPDRRSKESLTGDAGHGHAVPSAHALHVLTAAPEALGKLVAHEATHLLMVDAWGIAGMPLIAEGLAVFVAGQYAGRPWSDYHFAPDEIPPLGALVGWDFRKLPEAKSYPLAAHFMSAAIELGGIAAVRDHLTSATAGTFDAALTRAGIERARLEERFRKTAGAE